MTRFDRVIPPGGGGGITVRINTEGYKGELYRRTEFFTNDPKNQRQVVTITALVKRPLSISRRYLCFTGPADTPITYTIEIKAELERPLALEAVQFDLKGKMTYQIEEVEKGRTFLLHFTTIPGFPGTHTGLIRLKTNYPEKPEVVIEIRAEIKSREEMRQMHRRSRRVL